MVMKQSGLLLALILIAGLLLVVPVTKVHGHGMGKETVGPKDVAGKMISLDIRLEPELRKVGEITDMTLTVNAIDAESNQIVPGTIVYDIAIHKFGTNKEIMRNRFHIMPDQETLKIIFKPDPTAESITIEGETMPNMGYMSTEEQDITVRGPVLLDAGLYIFTIDLVGIGEEFLDEPVRYVSYLTISEQGLWEVEYKGEKREIEYISYFDRVKELTLRVEHDDSIVVEAVSDFNWDKDFVKDIPLLHFEYYISKDRFPELANREMKGYVNDMDASVFVDRATEGYVVVHYMIIKSRLVKMTEMIKEDERNKVVFTLIAGKVLDEEKPSPGAEKPLDKDNEITWSDAMVLKSDKGKYIAEVRYSPKEPNIDEPTMLQIKIYDANTMAEIKDINYRLMIYNQDRVLVDDVATGEVEMLKYELKDAGSYAVVLNINGDEDRVMFGINVVPEFPGHVLIALMTAMLGVSLFIRSVVRKQYNTF